MQKLLTVYSWRCVFFTSRVFLRGIIVLPLHKMKNSNENIEMIPFNDYVQFCGLKSNIIYGRNLVNPGKKCIYSWEVTIVRLRENPQPCIILWLQQRVPLLLF